MSLLYVHSTDKICLVVLAAVTHTTTGVSTGNVGVGGVGPVGSVGGVGGVGGSGNAMGGVSQLGGVSNAPAAPAAPAPAPSTQGADMKRAYEALGIACPTSVSNMVGGGFPRAPLSRMPVPRPPNLSDVVPQQQQTIQSLFAQQPSDLQQQQQQQQQLVSAGLTIPACRS